MDATGKPTVLEVVAALKHDLAKYVAWRSASLPESAWSGDVQDELVEALRADIQRTWSDQGNILAAWDVFDRHTRALARPWTIPELALVAVEVDKLRNWDGLLSSGDSAGIGLIREDVRGAQQAIRTLLSALHRRLLKEDG